MNLTGRLSVWNAFKDVADEFVRVRLTRIDNLDLNLFEFDYDLTFMVFFLNADGKVYARYGGRDGKAPTSANRWTGSATPWHPCSGRTAARESLCPAGRRRHRRYIRDVAGARRRGGCMHCHQVKEVLNAELQRGGKWSRDLVWRYPAAREPWLWSWRSIAATWSRRSRTTSPAAAAGLRAGDVVRRLNGVPIHSLADAQFALDLAPKAGSVEIVWQRGDKQLKDKLALPDGWRKTDITWRPSMQRPGAVRAALRHRPDGRGEERRWACRPNSSPSGRRIPRRPRRQAAGIRAGDVILGVDDKRSS